MAQGSIVVYSKRVIVQQNMDQVKCASSTVPCCIGLPWCEMTKTYMMMTSRMLQFLTDEQQGEAAGSCSCLPDIVRSSSDADR